VASQVLKLIYQKSLVEAVGGEDGYYLIRIRRMIAGENLPYTSEMNWLKVDFLNQDPQLNEAINELSNVDAKVQLFGWIPWL